MQERNELVSRASVIVIHPYQQHSLKTAVAIKQAGMLCKYLTTVYNKKGSWTYKFQFLLSKEDQKRAEKRKIHGLEDSDVHQLCEIRSLFLLLLQRIDKSRKIYNWYFQRIIKIFNKKAYKYILSVKPDAIIVYDTMCADLIKLIRTGWQDVKIILDMSAPYYNYMECAFEQDIDKHPGYSADLKKMLNSSIYTYRRDYSKYEIENADAFLVASTFTRNSLKWGGVNKDIYLCQYGIDDFVNINDRSVSPRKIEYPLRVIYVGRVNQAKGAYQLIELASRCSESQIQFDFYGSFDPDSLIIQSASKICHFHGHVPRSEMIKAYSDADMLILPSLADGFGFVIPEALSYSLPVITSDSVGAAQLIKPGLNGYIFESGNDEQLLSIVQSLIDNPNCLIKMRENCKKSVEHLSWQNYNLQVRMALDDIFKKI